LLPALLKEGYRERFAIGLPDSLRSLGLLFPLSVPLILYGIVASRSPSRICSSAASSRAS
jgi:TRAP-type C4-dicarboxylate transport system permease large subunit